jgi:hypothetical protein
MRYFLNIFVYALLSVLLASCSTKLDVVTIPQNEAVIRSVEKMPRAGGYSTGSHANYSLSKAIKVYSTGVKVSPHKAKPSYCSGATYLALLEMVESAQQRGDFQLSDAEALALLVYGQADGHGVWGRWNANGPGAAKLVHDLGMGINFESYSKAQPGDFMKIFWSDEIGKNEFGHLVVYLGSYQHDGVDYVKFWSSNQPSGYGVKSVPKSAVKWAIFTRITNLSKIKGVDALSTEDHFLSSMLTRSYSRAQARRKCGIR